MFTIPRPTVIQSDSGFSVEVLGRTGLKYEERGKSLSVDSEVLQGPSGLIIYADSIAKWNDGELIDVVERDQIVQNILAAFQFRGLQIQVG